MMSVKYFQTRILIKPLALASGHGRHIAVKLERTLFRWRMAVICSRFKIVTVSLPLHLDPEVVLKCPLELLESSIIDVIVFQGGDDGPGYRNM